MADRGNRLSVDTYVQVGCTKIIRETTVKSRSNIEFYLMLPSRTISESSLPEDEPHFLNSETRSRLNAALINARCENACGVFPSCSPLLEISSLNIIK